MRATTTRRRFLCGLGGLTLGLPFLELTASPARAQGQAIPRYVQFLHAHGTYFHQWQPAAFGKNFQLTPVLSPLSPVQDDLVIVSGAWTKVAELNEQALVDGHMRNTVSVLTGEPIFENVVNGQHVNNVQFGFANGPSIDQVIADRIRGDAPHLSIDLGVGVDPNENVILHAGPNDPVALEMSPAAAFDKLFTGHDPMAQDTLSRLRSHRKSVLDAVSDSMTDLTGRLGQADRHRLEAHAEKIRELEKQIDGGGNPGNGCMTPQLEYPNGYQPQDHAFVNVTSRLMIDVLVMALACDMTRVGTVQYTDVQGPWFPWLGVDAYMGYGSFHDRVHLSPGNDPDFLKIMQWYMEELEYLIRRLKETPDGDGTLLDHSLVLSVSEFFSGWSHAYYEPLPIVLAGGACGNLETGRHVNAAGHSNTDVWLSLLHKMGQNDNCFGWPDYCSGPVSSL